MKTHLTVVEVVWVCLCLDWKTKSWQGPGKAEQLRAGPGWGLNTIFGSLWLSAEAVQDDFSVLKDPECVFLPGYTSLSTVFFFPSISLSKIWFLILTPILSYCVKIHLSCWKKEEGIKQRYIFEGYILDSIMPIFWLCHRFCPFSLLLPSSFWATSVETGSQQSI